MKTIQVFITTFIGVLILYPSLCPAQEIGPYIEQYESRYGTSAIKIKLLRIGNKTDEEVLIQVLGVEDPLNNLIYKYKKQWKDRDKRVNEYKYVTKQVPGKESFSVFHSESSLGRQVFKIFLSNEPKNAIEIYPASHPKDLDPREMYEQYLEQQEMLLKNGLGLLVI